MVEHGEDCQVPYSDSHQWLPVFVAQCYFLMYLKPGHIEKEVEVPYRIAPQLMKH